jgi:hypothetical protein
LARNSSIKLLRHSKAVHGRAAYKQSDGVSNVSRAEKVRMPTASYWRMLQTRAKSIERLFMALPLAVGEQARTVDDSDKSSSKPVLNIKFAALRALDDAPLINTKVWCG